MSLLFKPLFLKILPYLLLHTLLVTVIFAAQPDNKIPLDRYQQALRVDPDNPTLHYMLGLAQLKNSQTKDAITSFRTAYPAYVDSIEMQINLGRAFSQIDDPDSAMLYLEQAEALGAMKQQNGFLLINAYYKVGLTYFDREAYDEAYSLFKHILTLDPDRIEIYRLLGDIAAKLGKKDESIAHFSRYLKQYPDDQAVQEYLYSIYFTDATQLQEHGDLTGAKEAFENARAISPGSPLIHYALGALAYDSNDPSMTIQHLKNAYTSVPLELKENTRSMLYNSVIKSLETKNLDLALAGISALITASDVRTKDLMLAGGIYLERQEFRAALKIFDRVLSREPTNTQATINRTVAEENVVDEFFREGLTAYKAERFAEAVSFFDDALAIYPDEKRSKKYRKLALEKKETDAIRLFKAAQESLNKKDYLTAVTAANKGLALAPHDTMGLRIRHKGLQQLKAELNQMVKNGLDLLQRSDFSAAEAQFKKALEIDPENRDAKLGLTKSKQQRQASARVKIAEAKFALDEGNLKAAEQSISAAEKISPELSDITRERVRFNALIASRVAEELLLGRGARSAGDLDKAVEHFTKVLELTDNPDIRQEFNSILDARAKLAEGSLQAARTARENRKFKTAMNIYSDILKINPQHPAKSELRELRLEINSVLVSHLKRARQKSKQGDYRSALTFYRQALDLDPASKEAQQELLRLRKQMNVDLAAHLETGQTAFKSGDLKKSATAYEKVLELDPYHAEAKAKLTKIANLEQTGIRPGDENRLYLQGIEFYTIGKYSEAIDAWEKVLQLTPMNNKARMNIEKAKRKLQSIQEFNRG
jgi:tetratricopeptide (TPR) repeat protein